jgi:hypothetical protein
LRAILLNSLRKRPLREASVSLERGYHELPPGKRLGGHRPNAVWCVCVVWRGSKHLELLLVERIEEEAHAVALELEARRRGRSRPATRFDSGAQSPSEPSVVLRRDRRLESLEAVREPIGWDGSSFDAHGLPALRFGRGREAGLRGGA